MLKLLKKSSALVLTLALAFTMLGVKTSAAETEPLYVDVTIGAPYEMYTTGFEVLTEEDLKDDFGIGLPTDGSDGYSAIRYVAKAMMRIICKKEKTMDPPTYTAEERAKARAEMPKYLNYKDGFLSGISSDGVTMNTGTTKEGKVDTTGYWYVYCNNKYADLGLGSLDLSKKICLNNAEENVNNLEVKWHSAPYDGGYGYQGLFDSEAFYHFIGDKTYGQDATEYTSLQIYKDMYVWDENAGADHKGGSVLKSSIAVSGASLEILTYPERKPVMSLTSDENGLFSIPETLTPGNYCISATEDVTKDGVTTSMMARAFTELEIIDSAGTPTNLKAKVKGKKSAKKKTITVSWKNTRNYESEIDSVQVYISKKKASGYKKVGLSVVGDNKFSFKKKKGTYFIKVRDIRSIDIGTEQLETVNNYGKYTAPIKVKVK